MASFSQLNLLMVFLLLLLLPFASVSSSSSSVSLSPSSVAKVPMSVYYDSLNGVTANYLTTLIPYIYQNNLNDMVNLNLVPYFDARIVGKSNVVCKRGPEECLLNRAQVCSIKLYPQEKSAKFIFYMSQFVAVKIAHEWEHCFQLARLNETLVLDCVNGPYGKQLENLYVKETSKVNHTETILPWIIIDKVHIIDRRMENLKSLICKSYKGVKSKACGEKIHPQAPAMESKGVAQMEH